METIANLWKSVEKLHPPPPCCAHRESCCFWGVVGLECHVTHLVWVSVEVKVLQETSSKFTEQEVVCVIDGPQTPVGVVVGTGARTERAH